MRNSLTILALLVTSLCFAQVKPNDFIEKTTAEPTDEIYSQVNDQPRRLTFATAKDYFLPEASNLPSAKAGDFNPASYPGQFVYDNNRNAWYVDAMGVPHRLALEVVTEMPTSEGDPGDVLTSNGDGTSTWDNPDPEYEGFQNHTGTSLTITAAISGNTQERVTVVRSGQELTEGQDYSLSGQTLTWVRPTTGENIKIWVD